MNSFLHGYTVSQFLFDTVQYIYKCTYHVTLKGAVKVYLSFRGMVNVNLGLAVIVGVNVSIS